MNEKDLSLRDALQLVADAEDSICTNCRRGLSDFSAPELYLMFLDLIKARCRGYAAIAKLESDGGWHFELSVEAEKRKRMVDAICELSYTKEVLSRFKQAPR